MVRSRRTTTASLATVAVAGVMACVHPVGGAHVPLLAWSNVRLRSDAPVPSAHIVLPESRLEAGSLSSLLHHTASPWPLDLAAAGAGGAQVHVFVFDTLSSKEVNRMASSALVTQAKLGAKALHGLTSLMTRAPTSFALPRFTPTVDVIAEVTAPWTAAGCQVVGVDATASAREAYMASLSHGSGGLGCRVHVVHLSHAALDDDLVFALHAATAIATSRSEHVTLVTAQGSGMAEDVPAAFGPRLLQTTGSNTTTTTTTDPIRIVPDIVTGLLIGLLLIIITAVGLQCTMAIRAPDVMHTPDNKLPAGKEY